VFAICPLSSIPVRANPSDSAEMTTQILFGEIVEIIKTVDRLDALNNGWLYIRCTWDNYNGWVTKKQLQIIDNEYITAVEKAYCYDLTNAVMGSDHSLPITIGASLPHFDGISFALGAAKYTFSGQAIYPSQLVANSTLLLKMARRYLYAPYLWGGRSPFGIDCSGFTQMCFAMLGTALPRDAYQQAESGENVDFLEQAQAGDLAYFQNTSGRIIHVGILMGEGLIIHASGHVRIDKIDHYGIYNVQTNRYSHVLRLVKRLLPKEETSEIAIVQKIVEEVNLNQISMF
jgi:hypothetical protein